MNKFNDFKLKEELLKALKQNHFNEPLKVQSTVIPCLLNNEDVLVQAKTGSGKTLSYLIPALNISSFKNNYTSTIILTPTRELALQVSEEAKSLAYLLKVNIVCIIGQNDYSMQINKLKHKPHIIVGTPGRIIELIKSENIALNKLKLTVIDEADEFESLGLKDQLLELTNLIPKTQIALFSATIKDSIVETPLKKIIIDEPDDVNKNIRQYYIKTNNKYNSLLEIINNTLIEQTIIYFNTKQNCIDIFNKLKNENILVDLIHGDMNQKQRVNIYNSFKEGKIRVLLASDVISRGIDFTNVSHIINYDIPTNIKTYIHRCGRSGRLANQGISISFISEDNNVAKYIIENGQMFIPDYISPSLNEEYKKDTKLKQTTSIIIRVGKKDKIRVMDIVGALSNYINSEIIGVINLQDRYATVEILESEFDISVLNNFKIKGKKQKVELTKMKLL